MGDPPKFLFVKTTKNMYYRRLLQYGRQIYFLYFLYKKMVAVEAIFKENQIGKVLI